MPFTQSIIASNAAVLRILTINATVVATIYYLLKMVRVVGVEPTRFFKARASKTRVASQLHHTREKMAVREGFEPPGPFEPVVFKTTAINRTLPSHRKLAEDEGFEPSGPFEPSL